MAAFEVIHVSGDTNHAMGVVDVGFKVEIADVVTEIFNVFLEMYGA